MKEYNICAAHAIFSVLNQNRHRNEKYNLSDIVDQLRKESKKMLLENSLTAFVSKVTVNHTFNVEAISRVLRKFDYKTKFIDILRKNLAKCMIISDNHHWISVVSRGNFLLVQSDNQEKLFLGDEKSTKRWLQCNGFISGLEIHQ